MVSIAMGADYSFNVKSIATYAPPFLGYNNSVLARVTESYSYILGMRAQNTALRSGSKLTETVMEALLDSRNCLDARYSQDTIIHKVKRTIKPWAVFVAETSK